MRWLACAALAFSAAVFAANYALPASWTPLCALLLALLSGAVGLLHRRWLRPTVVALMAAALGLGCFYSQDRFIAEPCRALDGETREITARLLEYPQVYDGYSSARVCLEGEDLPRVDALLYVNGGFIDLAEPGQLLHFTAKLRSTDSRYGVAYRGYYAKDIYLRLSIDKPILVTDRGFDLRTLPVRIQHRLSETALSLFPEDTSPFIKALMLGDKTELYREKALELALSRAGLMHVAAVSGMHIAFLVGFLQLLLGKSRRSSLLCMLLLWSFVLISGASPSSVRAGVMQTLLLAAPLVRRENDPLTSLSAALALLLLINPYAAASVSLQLSFAAMAGILAFAERLRENFAAPFADGPFAGAGRLIAASAAVSVSALIFAIPLMAVHFGTVAILSPLASLLSLWAVSLCFGLAWLSCFASLLLPALGQALAWITAWPARYIFLVARLISSVPFSVLYARNTLALLWLLLVYAAFAAAAIAGLRRPWRLLLPAALAALALFAVTGVTRWSYSREPGVITALDVGQGQCVCAYAGDKTLVVDCGGLYSGGNAGETAGEYLLSCERRRVDLLLLTHLHEDHANGVPMLLEMLPVERIVMPLPEDENDALYREICGSAREKGTEILYLVDDLHLTLGGMELFIYSPEPESRENERCAALLASFGSYDILITGDASAAREEELTEHLPLGGTELFIAGHHGSRKANSERLLSQLGGDTAIISVGYNNYGHPADEVLERFAAYGYTVYRTDQNGDITIRIGREYGEA